MQQSVSLVFDFDCVQSPDRPMSKVTLPAFIMSCPSPASVDTSSAHISIHSVLLHLLTKWLFTSQKRLSVDGGKALSATTLLLYYFLCTCSRRPCADGIYRYQYIKFNAHMIRACRMVGARRPRGTYHWRYNLLLPMYSGVCAKFEEANFVRVWCSGGPLDEMNYLIITRPDETRPSSL